MSQLTLDFEASLAERHNSLREYIAFRVQVQHKSAKAIAGDMDMAGSTLSRKLAPRDDDTQRFNVDDLERFIQVTGDTTAIDYLVSKYMHSDESRKARALARVEQLSTELAQALAGLKATT